MNVHCAQIVRPHREQQHQRRKLELNGPTHWSKVLLYTILCLNYILLFTSAHVALTYPPARKYDLDFLDNSHTKGPCGMPKGPVRTSILSGSKFNATWEMAYPHKGGFRLQILDTLDRPLVDLTPQVNGSEFVRTDATAQSFQVTLPNDFDCHNCTLRLLHQADEWSSAYRFWSCADIDIKPRKEFKETCSGNGRYFPSLCKCERNFYGHQCQYRDECTAHQDCGIQGKCIDLEGTSLPRKQCYCNYGWYGARCKERSPYRNTNVDLAAYAMKELSPDYKIYWRLLVEQNEIEVVLKVNGTTWVGFGWRPRSLNKECKNFPLIEEVRDFTTSLQGSLFDSTKSEPKSESRPNSKSESFSQLGPNSNIFEPKSVPECLSDPKSKTELTSESEFKLEFSSKSKCLAGNENTTSIDGMTLATSISYRISTSTGRRNRETSDAIQNVNRPDNDKHSNFVAVPEPKLESDPTLENALKSNAKLPSQAKSNSEVQFVSEPETKSELEPRSEQKPKLSLEQQSKTVPLLKSAPKSSIYQSVETGFKKYKSNSDKPTVHDFHPMDCTDIIIGSARGMASRIGDYYTRDRSTPRHDEYFGGKNDLSLATGFEQDGVTTIIFRKKLVATEPTDHTLYDDLTHVIWAKGQETGNYVHVPASGIETQMFSVKDFYQPDELKYHGHKIQRGVTQINFFEKEKPKSSESNEDNSVLDNDCYGHWKYPSNCLPQNNSCQYYASWETIGRGDEMRWHIEAADTQTWTGIGFSNDEKMSQTDSIIGWVDRNGRAFLMDTWINGYSSPKLDDNQDVVDGSGRIEKGVTILEFTRKRISNDDQDFSFTDDHCLYLFFPVLGGAFNAVNKKIRKHESVPLISSTRVCIKSCGKELEQILNVQTTPAPNSLVYAVGVKLINLAESFEAPEPGTVEFKNLAATISDSFNGVLNYIPGYYKTYILGFEKEGPASMVAKLQAMFDKDAYEKGNAVTRDTILRDDKQIALKNGGIIQMALSDKISSGKVGSLRVDPQFLDFRVLEYKSSDGSTETKLSFFELSEVRLYTVLGLIAALIFVALIQASCTVYKTSKNNKLNKENLIKNSPWKGYSSNTNYAFDPYGETEEREVKSATETSNKNKNYSQRSSANSRQTTLQMSHSPTNRSESYNNNMVNSDSSNYNATTNMQEYCTNSSSHQRIENIKSIPAAKNGNSHCDRYYHTEYNEPSKSQYQQSSSGYSRNSYDDRTYSLPRHIHQQHENLQPSGYYTQNRRDRSAQSQSAKDERLQSHEGSREDPRLVSSTGADTPDFYFMPSQRKYSGEVVRVYVDYNKDPKP